MDQDTSSADSHQKRGVLLKDQVRLVKRKDCDRYEIASIQDPLSFEKGFFVVIRACQLLAQKNEGIILVGVAGPSGAGKTVFTEKILSFMPSVAVISMDNYNDASRIVDGNFDGKPSFLLIFFFYRAFSIILLVDYSLEVTVISEMFLHKPYRIISVIVSWQSYECQYQNL